MQTYQVPAIQAVNPFPEAVVSNRPSDATSAAATAATSSRAEPTIWQTMSWSIFWASVIMFLATGLPMWWLTGQIWDGIGLGAYCAFWGGPGFGAMAGGAIWTARQERAHQQPNSVAE